MENINAREEILTYEGIRDSLEKLDKYYMYGEKRVPRVTQIISQCDNQQGLITWAASIGYRKYNSIRDKSLEVGTLVHEFIDQYLISKYNYGRDYNIDYESIEPEYRESVYNSFENFKLWEKNLNFLGYKIEEIVGLEIPIITPYYGGTIDGIVKINGVYYIIDFKTSKNISNSYFIQTAAYMWGVNNGYGDNLPIINGLGIIRIDKSKYGVIDDLFLNASNPIQNNIITQHISCFWSYLEAYYRSMNINYIDNYYRKSYDIKTVL